MKKCFFASAILVSFAFASCERDALNVDNPSIIEDESVACNESSSFEVIDIQSYSPTELAEKIGIEAPVETKGISLTYEVVRMSYKSTGADGNPIALSMKVTYPKSIFGTYHKPTHIVLDNHITIGANSEAPYYADQIAMGTALNDALVVCPDYEGYGLSSKNIPPYICHEINAIQSVDAVLAALDYIDAKKGISMAKNSWLENYGYSQGGGIALAVHKYIETELSSALQKRLNLKHSYCGGGPYNPVTTFRVYREWDHITTPMVAILPILGARVCYPEILGKYNITEFFSDEFNKTEMIDRILSKKYTVDELNQYLKEEKKLQNCSQIFSDKVLDENSQIFKDIVCCLQKSDLTQGWKPKAAVSLYHSKQDNLVPAENCDEAYTGLVGGNIEREWAPFDPSHVKTAICFYLRFYKLNAVFGALAGPLWDYLEALDM